MKKYIQIVCSIVTLAGLTACQTINPQVSQSAYIAGGSAGGSQSPSPTTRPAKKTEPTQAALSNLTTWGETGKSAYWWNYTGNGKASYQATSPDEPVFCDRSTSRTWRAACHNEVWVAEAPQQRTSVGVGGITQTQTVIINPGPNPGVEFVKGFVGALIPKVDVAFYPAGGGGGYSSGNCYPSQGQRQIMMPPPQPNGRCYLPPPPRGRCDVYGGGGMYRGRQYPAPIAAPGAFNR